MPDNIKAFLNWGERTPLVRRRRGEEPKKANESMASKAREKSKDFFGWYDLGGVIKTPIFTSRRAQYRHRFVMLEIEKCALDDGFITFIPRQKFTKNELLAELAYLNSDLMNFFIEIYGRSTGGGVIELDDKSAGKLPVLNCKRLSKDQIELLADLFEKLENHARKIGGAETEENLKKLQPVIEEINEKISEILRLENTLLEKIKKISILLSERRIARTKRARPETVKGEETPRIKPPKRRRGRKSEEVHRPLTRWM